MNGVLKSTAKTQALTPLRLYELTVNGFNASFVSAEKRAPWLQQAKDVYEEVTGCIAP